MTTQMKEDKCSLKESCPSGRRALNDASCWRKYRKGLMKLCASKPRRRGSLTSYDTRDRKRRLKTRLHGPKKHLCRNQGARSYNPPLLGVGRCLELLGCLE